MGFSNEDTPADAAGQAAQAKPNFGDRLGGYLQERYPVAGGLSDMVFGQSAAPTAGQFMPPTQDQHAQTPQPELIGMNAQPKQGGLGALLKLFA